MALKENYKDDILDTSQNVKRKYQMENNGDGTVSFTDVTEYTQQGDSFGSGAINPIAHAINGLNNYNFHPSGSIDLVAYIADDSYYLNEDNKYVLADSTIGQALINSDPSTYKALASNTDLYGIEGEDTVSGFEPSSTPIEVGGETLSTIDDKINYLVENKIALSEVSLLNNNNEATVTVDFNGEVIVSVGSLGGNTIACTCKKNGVEVNPIANTRIYAVYSGMVRGYLWHFSVSVGDTIICSDNNSNKGAVFMIMKMI